MPKRIWTSWFITFEDIMEKGPDKDIRSLDTERLKNYYGIILKSWLVNPILEVSDDLNEEYKRIVKYYNDLIKE